MPTYEYACTACGQHVEVFQRFSEAPLTTCGVCGGELRKVFHPAGIVFKGSGFYATDSRSGAKGSSGDGASPREGSTAKGSNDGAKDGTKDGGKTSPSGDAKGASAPPKERTA